MDTLIILHDGTTKSLSGLDVGTLRALQWQEERMFAKRIMSTAKGSEERAEITRHAYETVSSILYNIKSTTSAHVAFGFQRRHERLVLDVLRGQKKLTSQSPRFFEIGFGLGALLKVVADSGYEVGGVEVNGRMVESAREKVASEFHAELLCGDLLSIDLRKQSKSYHVAYWNDVLEHIPPDESREYLCRIRDLLAPKGKLITITPNWYVRPSDVTRLFRPGRAEPEGFHLKEYKLAELLEMLTEAGFHTHSMPLLVLPDRTYLCGRGLLKLKQLVEPVLEYIPLRLARKLAGGLGYNCVIASRRV